MTDGWWRYPNPTTLGKYADRWRARQQLKFLNEQPSAFLHWVEEHPDDEFRWWVRRRPVRGEGPGDPEVGS